VLDRASFFIVNLSVGVEEFAEKLAGWRSPKTPESGLLILRTDPMLTLANESVGDSCTDEEDDCCGLDDELPELLLLLERLIDEAEATAEAASTSNTKAVNTLVESDNWLQSGGGRILA
jgi:hypothetical protein